MYDTDLIRLVRPPGPRGFCDWPFIWCDTFLRCSIELCLQGCFDVGKPRLFLTKTPLFPNSQEYHQPTILNSSSSTTAQAAKSGRCLNIPSMILVTPSIMRILLIMWNNCTIADDRSQFLSWLSPLEPKIGHQDIQERPVFASGRPGLWAAVRLLKLI